jgi:hypothetical protein
MFLDMTYVDVRIGQYREFYELWEKLDQTIRAKNLKPSQLLVATTGLYNACVVMTEYETIEAWHGEGDTFQSDADCMSIWREMGKYLEARPRVELWETSAQIA